MDGQPVDAAPSEVSAALWVSISELARRKGKSKQAVSKRVKRLRDSGTITVREDGSEVLVNIVEYDRAIGETTDPAQALRNPGLDILSTSLPSAAASEDEPTPRSKGYLAHKENSAAYQAENDRLDLEERLGRTCDRADVETRTFAVFRRLRDRLLSLPAICAPLVANASDERAARVILDGEIRKLLDALAKSLDRPEDADDDVDEDAAGVSAAGLQ